MIRLARPRAGKMKGLGSGMLFLVLVLGVLPAWGNDSLVPGQKPIDQADDSLAPGQKWIEQVDGGFVFPVSTSAAANFDRGVGGDILVGYRFNRDFSLSADLGYYDCDAKGGGATAGEWIYTPVLAVARFNFGAGTVRPYLIFGAGAAFNTFSFTPVSSVLQSKSETDFLLAPGVGILFVVATNMALYVQGRMDMDFIATGMLGGPFIESPVIFVPVKVGASFFVL
ncbi:MAG TPA: outer membrane beta-barrel protein [bacterium]